MTANANTVRIDYAQADKMVLEALAPLDRAASPTPGELNIRALGDSADIDYDYPFVFFTGVDCQTAGSSSAPSPHRASVTVKLVVGVAGTLVAEDAYALATACSRVVHALERLTLDEVTLGHRMELEQATVTRLGAIDPIGEQEAPDIVGAAITITGTIIRQAGNSIGSA